MNCKGNNCSLETYYPQTLSILVIDDEKKAVENLTSILKHDPGISVSKADDKKDVLEHILEVQPDIIFIDPSVNKGSGVEIIDQIIGKDEHPGIVVMTASSKEIEKTFRLNVLTVVKKPVDSQEVHRAIQDYLSVRSFNSLKSGLDKLLSGLMQKKIKFSTRKGHVFLSASEIIYCKADSNYTHIVLTGKRQITVSKSLHHFDNKILSPDYYRISRSAIINTEYLVEINRNEKNCILKQNDEFIALPVTQKYLKKLLDHYCSCYLPNH